VHASESAAESTRAVNALAYTSGRDVIFGAGEYSPGTDAGKRLLAHELVHTIQQQAVPAAESPDIQRQATNGSEGTEPRIPSFSVPPGLTFFPGPLTLSPAIFGTQLPVPASLRVTNALGFGPGPSFVADLSPRLLVLHLLENIDLHSRPRSGAQPGAEGDPANQAKISLVTPTLTFDPETRRLRGWGVLSVAQDYPEGLVTPTNVKVEITSSELGQFSGTLGYGPLHADFALKLHYDTAALERSLSSAFAPTGGLAALWERYRRLLESTMPGAKVDAFSTGLRTLLLSIRSGSIDTEHFVIGTIDLIRDGIPPGVNLDSLRKALTSLGREISHPGFTLRGGLRLGPVPLSRFTATAPTTKPLARPLLGAPTAFPLTYSAYGAIVAPAGSITDVPVPAAGGTYSSFGAKSGLAGTVAALPTLSLSAISSKESVVRQLPVYAYAEGTYVRRISEDLDLGFRLTIQVSTKELFGGSAADSADPAERLKSTIRQYQEAKTAGLAEKASLPNIGLTVFGRFNAF
jgi:hypothetical protein